MLCPCVCLRTDRKRILRVLRRGVVLGADEGVVVHHRARAWRHRFERLQHLARHAEIRRREGGPVRILPIGQLWDGAAEDVRAFVARESRQLLGLSLQRLLSAKANPRGS